MKENVRFYRCNICGNIIGLIHGDMEHMQCCGQKLELLKANKKLFNERNRKQI